jgi:antitoxin ParD1/3/4
MYQMNISITDQLASYVPKKVKSGRYNNASEVFREAIRRMEQQEQRELRLAKPSVEDILTDLTEQQINDIRERVPQGSTSVDGLPRLKRCEARPGRNFIELLLPHTAGIRTYHRLSGFAVESVCEVRQVS